MSRLQQWLGDQLDYLAQTLRSKPINRDHLKAAIIKRRDRHRRLNDDWQHVDQDVITQSS